jgi:hypothetical protein
VNCTVLFFSGSQGDPPTGRPRPATRRTARPSRRARPAGTRAPRARVSACRCARSGAADPPDTYRQEPELGRLARVLEARGPARADVTRRTAIALVRLGQEGLDVGGELGVMLEQEPVRGVGVDLHRGVRDPRLLPIAAGGPAGDWGFLVSPTRRRAASSPPVTDPVARSRGGWRQTGVGPTLSVVEGSVADAIARKA